MKRAVILITLLIVLYLIVSNPIIYKSLAEWIGATFRRFYKPLVTGEDK